MTAFEWSMPALTSLDEAFRNFIRESSDCHNKDLHESRDVVPMSARNSTRNQELLYFPIIKRSIVTLSRSCYPLPFLSSSPALSKSSSNLPQTTLFSTVLRLRAPYYKPIPHLSYNSPTPRYTALPLARYRCAGGGFLRMRVLCKPSR